VPTWFHPDLLKASGTAFLIALVLTPILRDIFRSYNIVDRPGQRKVHQYPIPRIGGIPIAVAYFAALWSLSSSNPALGVNFQKLLPGAAVVFLTGLVDDFVNLKPLVKLLGQIAAALIVFWSGIRIEGVAGQPLPLWLNLLLTVLWLLLSTNALNLIDGLDGLCAGIGFVATLTLVCAAVIHGDTGLANATLPLAGALLGFISYNLNPATVFLGDSGAMLIGFLLGCYGMIWTQKTATLLSLLVPLLALAVPLLDVSLAILRRLLSKRSVFSADRAHIHHRLLDHGFTPRRAVLVLYVFAAVIAIIAVLLSSPLSRTYQNVIMVFILGIVLLGVRQLRYQEFQAAGQFLVGGEFQRRLRDKMRLDQLRTDLDRVGTAEEWWETVGSFAKEQGWVAIGWDGPRGVKKVQIVDREPDWTLSVPLAAAGTLTIQGATGRDNLSPDVGAVARILRSSVHT